jgi:hypothetical protein
MDTLDVFLPKGVEAASCAAEGMLDLVRYASLMLEFTRVPLKVWERDVCGSGRCSVLSGVEVWGSVETGLVVGVLIDVPYDGARRMGGRSGQPAGDGFFVLPFEKVSVIWCCTNVGF